MDILLAGATGLVGGLCLQRLLADPVFTRVVVLARRPVDTSHPKLEQHVVDFARLDEARALFKVDKMICALGTTIKQAGSQERFREVDHDYPLQLACLGREQGARHLLLVSALGANVKSGVFYNRVKGEVETDVRALEWPQLTIMRPSLLLGERQAFRFGEEMGKRLAFLVPGRYKPVQADDVAKVLVEAARRDAPGVEIIESDEIRRRAA
ncbi:oxidoreductase [Noviherbaspirillum sp. ST9]|uniref:oxidoreductase n=1 Tax=Noviherbaspirillum sp. ST9 TaxID=3401606 RepID=UPI003B58A37A